MDTLGIQNMQAFDLGENDLYTYFKACSLYIKDSSGLLPEEYGNCDDFSLDQ